MPALAWKDRSAIAVSLRTAAAAGTSLTLAGCELIGDIFKAGVWTGVVLVVAVIAGIVFVVAKLRK